jgi:hypothetical protein
MATAVAPSFGKYPFQLHQPDAPAACNFRWRLAQFVTFLVAFVAVPRIYTKV